MRASAFSAIAAVFLFFQIGYGFESGDQLQYLLLPYRSIYPNFLPGDWFTWHTSHYHETFSWLVRALHALSGEAAFPYAMLAAQLLTLAALAYAILRLSEAVELGLVEAAIVVLVLGCIREAGIAGSTLNHGRLLPADMALPPFLLACAAWARGQKPWAVGAWLGVSGFLHANFAVLGPAVLGPLVLMQALRARRLSSIVPMVLAYALLAAPTLLLIARSFATNDTAPAELAITLFIRSPHHYDLRAIAPADFCWPILLLLAGLPTWMRRQSSGHAARVSLLLASFGVVALAIVGAALHSIFLARLFAWRMSVPMQIVLLLAFAHSVRSSWQEHVRRPALWHVWSVTCVAWILVFAREDLSMVAPQLSVRALWPLAIATLALLAPFSATPWHVIATRTIGGAATLVSLALAAQIALVPLTLLDTGRGKKPDPARGVHFFDGKITVEAPKRELYDKIRARTPIDARFLIPPGLIDFRMLTRRTVFVDWKCAPMKGDEALVWKQRMLLAMGVPDFPSRSYRLRSDANRLYLARPISQLAALARSAGMTHLVVATRRRGTVPSDLRIVFGNQDYSVFTFRAH